MKYSAEMENRFLETALHKVVVQFTRFYPGMKMGGGGGSQERQYIENKSVNDWQSSRPVVKPTTYKQLLAGMNLC